MFTPLTEEADAKFRHEFRNGFPGGSILIDHLDRGPWWVTVIGQMDSPWLTLQHALAACPSADLPYNSYAGITEHPVFVMPNLVLELAHYHFDEYRFAFDGDWEPLRFDRPVTAADHAAILGRLLRPRRGSSPTPEESAADVEIEDLVRRLVPVLGTALLSERILDADAHGDLTTDTDLVSYLQALAAANDA